MSFTTKTKVVDPTPIDLKACDNAVKYNIKNGFSIKPPDKGKRSSSNIHYGLRPSNEQNITRVIYFVPFPLLDENSIEKIIKEAKEKNKKLKQDNPNIFDPKSFSDPSVDFFGHFQFDIGIQTLTTHEDYKIYKKDYTEMCNYVINHKKALENSNNKMKDKFHLQFIIVTLPRNKAELDCTKELFAGLSSKDLFFIQAHGNHSDRIAVPPLILSPSYLVSSLITLNFPKNDSPTLYAWTCDAASTRIPKDEKNFCQGFFQALKESGFMHTVMMGPTELLVNQPDGPTYVGKLNGKTKEPLSEGEATFMVFKSPGTPFNENPKEGISTHAIKLAITNQQKVEKRLMEEDLAHIKDRDQWKQEEKFEHLEQPEEEFEDLEQKVKELEDLEQQVGKLENREYEQTELENLLSSINKKDLFDSLSRDFEIAEDNNSLVVRFVEELSRNNHKEEDHNKKDNKNSIVQKQTPTG